MPTNQEAVSSLLQSSHDGALATVDEKGAFASAVGFWFSRQESTESKPVPGKVYLLLSDLARHSRNLKRSVRTSLLVIEERSDIPMHEKKRITLNGEVRLVSDKETFDALKKRYLEKYPKSEIFFMLPDFRFYELVIDEVHWIGGFGKAETWA